MPRGRERQPRKRKRAVDTPGGELRRIELADAPDARRENRIAVWMSDQYLIELYRDDRFETIELCRTSAGDEFGRPQTNLSRGEIQALLAITKLDDKDAVELFPARHPLTELPPPRRVLYRLSKPFAVRVQEPSQDFELEHIPEEEATR